MTMFYRNTFTRFTIAADCLDALSQCLTNVPSSGDESYSILRLIRQIGLTSSVVCGFVELGQLLEKNILQQRLEMFGDSNDIDADKSSSFLSNDKSVRLEFEPWERRLWYVYKFHVTCLSFS